MEKLSLQGQDMKKECLLKLWNYYQTYYIYGNNKENNNHNTQSNHHRNDSDSLNNIDCKHGILKILLSLSRNEDTIYNMSDVSNNQYKHMQQLCKYIDKLNLDFLNQNGNNTNINKHASAMITDDIIEHSIDLINDNTHSKCIETIQVNCI